MQTLGETLPNHYQNWLSKKPDKQLHPLYLIWSGPGTGKSRTLEEFQKICIKSISDPILRKQLEEAYVFQVNLIYLSKKN